jgi:integrase
VGAATQNQAANALLFLYRTVLGRDPGAIDCIVRARKGKRVPVVLEREEVAEVIDRLERPYRLIATLLYGSGLRLSEALKLRIHDIELERREILVRGGKGDQDRVTMLPETARMALVEQTGFAGAQHERDRARAPAGSISRTRWEGSTRTPPGSSGGSGSSRRREWRSSTKPRPRCAAAGTLCARPPCSEP